MTGRIMNTSQLDQEFREWAVENCPDELKKAEDEGWCVKCKMARHLSLYRMTKILKQKGASGDVIQDYIKKAYDSVFNYYLDKASQDIHSDNQNTKKSDE